MHLEVSQPTRQCPESLRKRNPAQKAPEPIAIVEQCPGAPLSHLPKIPSATSG